MTLGPIPNLVPSWQLVKHELGWMNQPPPIYMPPASTNIDFLGAQVDRDRARHQEFERALGLNNSAATQRAANLLLGTQPSTIWGRPTPTSNTSFGTFRDVNGGAAAWGGGRFGIPNPNTVIATQTLPKIASPLRPSFWINSAKQLYGYWNKYGWVVKEGATKFGYVGDVLTAYQILQWAVKHWPGGTPATMPSRVKTQYVIGSASLLYEWPGGYWREFPPPGYGSGGGKLW